MSTFEKVAELIAEHVDCDVQSVQADTRFADLGIDSLDTVEIFMQLEDKLGK